MTVEFIDTNISAMASGAEILWSEDLGHAQEFGKVVVRNPFL